MASAAAGDVLVGLVCLTLAPSLREQHNAERLEKTKTTLPHFIVHIG